MKKYLLAATLTLAACPKDQVAFPELEKSRTQAKANGFKNAQLYRSERKMSYEYDIISNGDSAITNECPNGDGWVSDELVKKSDGSTIKLKCSTTSITLGCLTEKEFALKSYAQEDGNCAPLIRVPHPIPPI